MASFPHSRVPARLSLSLLSTALCALVASEVVAADWPQWRGPNRDGKSPETGLLQSWPKGGPPLAFKAEGLGGGFSSVAVAGGRVFTMGDLPGEGDAAGQHVLALDAGSGKHLWKTRVGPSWEDQYLGPRSTPTVDGDRVYLMSTEGDVVCLEAATGKEHWRRNLPKDFGGAMMKAQGSWDWKFSESPLVDGDRVIVTPGSKKAALVALDKKAGKEIWRSAVPDLGEHGTDGAAYSSVVVSHGGGVRQYVQFLGRAVIGVEAETGRFLWHYGRVANAIANIATPIIDGDHVFASSGYRTGSALIRLTAGASGDGAKADAPTVKAEEVYFLEPTVMQNHHGGLILHEGHVYTGTGHNKGFPIAVELASGKVAWGPERNAGDSSAAITYADGRIYFRYQNGMVILVEATPAGYREHGSFEIPGVKQPSWPHPVIAGGKLFLREQSDLFVYDVKAQAKAAKKAAPAR